MHTRNSHESTQPGWNNHGIPQTAVERKLVLENDILTFIDLVKWQSVLQVCQLGNSKPLPSVLDFTVFSYKTTFSETTFEFFFLLLLLYQPAVLLFLKQSGATTWIVAVDKCNTESKWSFTIEYRATEGTCKLLNLCYSSHSANGIAVHHKVKTKNRCMRKACFYTSLTSFDWPRLS